MAAKRPKKTSKAKKAKGAPSRAANAQPKPRTVTPYLAVNNAVEAIEWYKRALGAKEQDRQLEPSGKVMHASLKIGDSQVFLSDMFPGTDMRDPLNVGGSTVYLHVFSKDIQKIWKSAVEAGARVTMPLAVQFWGDRYGKLQDPFGHSWGFSYPAKVNATEKERLRVEAMKQMGQGDPPGTTQGTM